MADFLDEERTWLEKELANAQNTLIDRWGTPKGI